MTTTLTLVGQSADFIDARTPGPAWEHQILLRAPDCRALRIDQLASGPRSRLPGRRYADLGLLWRLARRLPTAGAVLAQSERSGYQAALASAAGWRHPRLGIIFHGHDWWTRRNRTLAAIIRRLPWVQVLCLSEALRRIVLREYRIPEARVLTTGYGVDADYFRPQPWPGTGEPVVAGAGTASRDYGLLAEAAAGLDARFRIAADSNWYREPLNIAPEAAPANLTLIGGLGYPELRALYAASRFVVVPLRDTEFAAGYAVIAEAMAMGRAVIATRTACPSDLIEDGISGLYVPPGDAAALRAAIRRLLEEPGLAARMGAAGRARVERAFTLTAYVGRLRGALGLPAEPAAREMPAGDASATGVRV